MTRRPQSPKFDGHPRWVTRIRWLWVQDECARDAERLEAAWRRIFGVALPPQHVGSVYDVTADLWRSIEGDAWRALWAAIYDGMLVRLSPNTACPDCFVVKLPRLRRADAGKRREG